MDGMVETPQLFARFCVRSTVVLALLAYGGIAGGVAGFLAMMFVVVFLFCGAPQVIAPSVWGSAFAVVRWCIYFLAFHFVLFCFSEQLSDDMLAFLASTLHGAASWLRSANATKRVGFAVGLMMVGGVAYVLCERMGW